MDKVTAAEKAEFLGEIIDIFEDFLEARSVELPHDEREQDPDNAAIIYGTDYGELQENLEDMMVNWGLMEMMVGTQEMGILYDIRGKSAAEINDALNQMDWTVA